MATTQSKTTQPGSTDLQITRVGARSARVANSADAVASDGEAEHRFTASDVDVYRLGLLVLGPLGEGFGDGVVGGHLERRGKPPGHAHSERDGNGRALGGRSEGRSEATL
jgi:hypothetical protein